MFIAQPIEARHGLDALGGHRSWPARVTVANQWGRSWPLTLATKAIYWSELRPTVSITPPMDVPHSPTFPVFRTAALHRPVRATPWSPLILRRPAEVPRRAHVLRVMAQAFIALRQV